MRVTRTGPTRRTWLVGGLLLCLLAQACTADGLDLPGYATATALPLPAASTPPTAAPSSPVPATSPTIPATPLAPDGPALPDLAGARTAVAAGLLDGDEVRITTVEGDRSWLLTVEAADPEDLVGIRRVTDPAGEIRYWADLRNEVVLVDGLDRRVLADAGAIGLYEVAGLGGSLPPGEWTVELATTGTAVTARSAVVAGDPSAPGRMDIAVWVTASIDPSGVAERWRADMDAVLSPHGLVVGALDLVMAGEAGAAHRALGLDDLAGDVHDACTAASAATGSASRTAVVLLAETIAEGALTAYRAPDGNVSGFTVSTPGTPVLGPPSHGCVAVAATDDPGSVGRIALHELLHLAGLSAHTTERDGRAFDDLADTPECPRSADVDADGTVSAAECAGSGADNLMFWAEGGSSLTPTQAWVARWHPLFHSQ